MKRRSPKLLTRTPARQPAAVLINDLQLSHDEPPREEKLITAILNTAKDLLVIVLDRKGCVLQFNRAAQELTGHSLDGMKGRRPWDILPLPKQIRGVMTTSPFAIVWV